MALHHDLLEQAEHLARREPKRPRQASLRRAVSTAYYAVFHLLTYEGGRQVAPATPAVLRATVQRAFQHGEMRSVCKSLMDRHNASSRPRHATGTGSAPQSVPDPLSFPLDQPLLDLIRTFVALQEARHRADYDLVHGWSRTEALMYVRLAREAFDNWSAVRGTSNAAVFLTALLLHRVWSR